MQLPRVISEALELNIEEIALSLFSGLPRPNRMQTSGNLYRGDASTPYSSCHRIQEVCRSSELYGSIIIYYSQPLPLDRATIKSRNGAARSMQDIEIIMLIV
jgi:hypothetical protein